MNFFWRAAFFLGVHPCAIYRRALYPSSTQTNSQPQAITPPPGVTVALGSTAQLMSAAQDPKYKLNANFIEQAFAAEHQVVLTYLNAVLVAYGWVSYSSTPHIDGWWIEFAPGHRYNYNNYTLPAHRGQRLRGSYGVLQTPDQEHGASHSIAFIAMNNQASIRAEQRNGGHRVGYAGYIHIGPLRWSFRTPGAKAVDFRFVYKV